MRPQGLPPPHILIDYTKKECGITDRVKEGDLLTVLQYPKTSANSKNLYQSGYLVRKTLDGI